MGSSLHPGQVGGGGERPAQPPVPALPAASAPDGQLTCRRKVMGCWPMAWASPMLARMTSVNGFLIP